MRVFITWSGPRSQQLAQALRTWLRHVVQYFEPWVSERDVPTGALWSPEIMSNLFSAEAGVICLTPENQVQPWVLFEAGALASRLGLESRVCIYLLGISPSD